MLLLQIPPDASLVTSERLPSFRIYQLCLQKHSSSTEASHPVPPSFYIASVVAGTPQRAPTTQFHLISEVLNLGVPFL